MKENDRELLGLAAKAAGITIDTHYVDGGASVWEGEPHNSDWMPDWNPFTDDGDALRLAVKLDLNVMIGVVRTPCGFTAIEYSETGGKDDNECTRRAIVRAAAEIGRSMP